MSYTKVKFKDYTPQQNLLFPPNLSEMISDNHPVRVVSDVIDRLDIECLIRKYKAGGTSSYHPRMLLKILVYGYLSNTYSSRKLEAATKENIHFMWLSGMQSPDHNTINRFRSTRLKDVVKEVFTQVVMLLVESGHVDLQRVYTDGTKIEANANKYTFVWGKAIKKNKIRIKDQLEDLWRYAEKVAKDELQDTHPCDFEKLDPKEVDKTIDKLNKVLKPKKEVPKERKQKLNYAKKNWPSNLKKYQNDEQILAGRNSYSKTDKDATFMRMKDDHMQNGQLKPGYNLQISTNNQFITHYSIHPNPTDTKTLIPHLQEFKQYYNTLPKELTADAGYGSEENYEYLQEQSVEAYVKYNYFHQEQKAQKSNKPAKKPFTQEKLHYNEQKDCYYCPMGQAMKNIGQKKEKSEAGYLKTTHLYQAENCKGCPLRGACHKSKGNRIIQVNHRLKVLKNQARERLLSDKGKAHRSQRPVDVEAVFGNMKQNKGFKRFNLRGNQKVEIEMGLLAMAMNLKKVA